MTSVAINRKPVVTNNVLHLPRQALSCSREADELPLWLTEHQLESLIALCVSSAADVGGTEDVILGKLGEMFRCFRR